MWLLLICIIIIYVIIYILRAQPVYLGPDVSVSLLLEESKQLKRNINIPYNLENDNLFGKPLSSTLEKFEK